MTIEEAQNLLNNSRPKGNNAYSIMLNEALNMAIKALEQMPVTTTTEGSAAIYYPQVEGVTPTVVDVRKQEPCDTCGYEEGSIYCKEHCPHEAKMDDLVKLCIEQELRDCKTCIHSDKGHCAGTEECHEGMWESKYEQAPCGDAISRENAIIRISWDFPTLEISKVKESLDKLPSVNPQPICEEREKGECPYYAG